jgi:release factor glutamine methyltransferase
LNKNNRRAANWVAEAQTKLRNAGCHSHFIEAQLLAAHALGQSRSWVLANPEAEVPTQADAALDRRLSGEPLAYILGYREFYGRRFYVEPGVLIPRHETEILVEVALAKLPPHAKVLELGFGSGCVAITLKQERPDLEITAVDASQIALKVAEKNATTLGASIDWRLGNWFDPIQDLRFDGIVSNPPYIDPTEPLPNEVAQFEPAEALFAGSGGLDAVHYFSKTAKSHLRPKAPLMLEVGHQQARPVQNLFIKNGWHHQETTLDLAGIERVLTFIAS